MSQNKWIPQDVLQNIYEMALNPEFYEPYRSRSAVARAIRSKLKEQQKMVPSQATVEKKISEYRKHEPDDKESPWRVSDLANPKYTIPSEALPTVLRAWAYEQVNYRRLLTVREALWVARLYYVFREAVLEEKPLLISTLCGIARSLESEEMFIERTRKRHVKPSEMYRWELETTLFELVAEESDPLREELESYLKQQKGVQNGRAYRQARQE